MSEPRPRYRVTVTREDGLWSAVVGGLPPSVVGATDVEHFADIEPAVRDLVAGLTDARTSDFDLTWRYVQGDHEYTPAIADLRTREAAVAEAAGSRDRARRAAIESMRAAGLSLRDIADVLGLSHQRVHQILKAGERTGSAQRRSA